MVLLHDLACVSHALVISSHALATSSFFVTATQSYPIHFVPSIDQVRLAFVRHGLDVGREVMHTTQRWEPSNHVGRSKVHGV